MFCCSSSHNISVDLLNEQRALIKKTALYVFILTGLVVVSRLIAYTISGSISVEAALYDAIKDTFVSLMNVGFIWFSSKPADKKFQFGYGKLESLASFIQALLLVVVGILIVIESLSFEQNLEHHFDKTSIIAMFVSLIFVISLAVLQTIFAKKINSTALYADSVHYKADVMMNIAVIVSLFSAGKLHWIDNVVGFVIAIYLIKAALSVGKIAVNCLLDKSLPDSIVNKIKDIIKDSGFDYANITTRSLGRGEYIFIQINQDKNLNADKLIENQKKLTHIIYEHFPTAQVEVSTVG